MPAIIFDQTLYDNKLRNNFKKLNLKTGDIVLIGLFFISLGLTIWGISIYRFTIIDTKYLLATIAIGICISLVALTFSVKSSYSTFWAAFIKTGIGGGFFYFGLLFLNQQFADKELLTNDFLIIKTGTLGRGGKSICSQPYAVIDFYGTEKELLFYCGFSEIIKRSSKVTLTYSKGTFGFNVIKSQSLRN